MASREGLAKCRPDGDGSTDALAGQPWLNPLAIRPLSARHRPEILEHLLGMSSDDRYLRFGYHASDEQITRYVEHLQFERDVIQGVFSQDLKLVAVSHLAFPLLGEQLNLRRGAGLIAPRVAEFGVSVLPALRRRRMGSQLYALAVEDARAHGMDALLIHALSKNAPMLRIVRRHGACVEQVGLDAQAELALPAAGWGWRLHHQLQHQIKRLCHALLGRSRMGRAWLCVE